MSMLDLRVPPLVVLAVCLVAAWGLAGAPLRLDVRAPQWLGLTLALVGVVVCLVALLQFRFAGTTVDPRVPGQSAAVVSSGIYGWSRNPMYLGMALVLAGTVMALGSMRAGLMLPVFIGYIGRFQIEPEERILRARFGGAYEAYCARVRRWM